MRKKKEKPQKTKEFEKEFPVPLPPLPPAPAKPEPALGLPIMALPEEASHSARGFEKGFPSPEMFRQGFYDQGIKHLFDKEKIEMIGRMSPDLVQIIRRLRIIANTYKIKEWQDTIEDFIAIGLSESGKSRDETLKMVGAMTKSKQKSKTDKGEEIEPRESEESL